VDHLEEVAPIHDLPAKEEDPRGVEDAAVVLRMESTARHLSVKMTVPPLLRSLRRSEYGTRSIPSWALRDSRVIELREKRKSGGWSICTRYVRPC
jgi:hypothetical protein